MLKATEVAGQNDTDRKGTQVGVADNELAKAAAYMQLENEQLQDVASRMLHLQYNDEYIIDWVESDPLLEVNRNEEVNMSVNIGSVAEHMDFFALAEGLEAGQVQQRKEGLLKGIAIIRRLQDPAYTAEYEYEEPDAEWLRRMKDQTTDPNTFETGHMHACADLWDLYFKEMGVKSKLANQVSIWMH